MDAGKRRALEARREALQAKIAADRVRRWMHDNAHLATFGPQPDDPAERIYRALGR